MEHRTSLISAVQPLPWYLLRLSESPNFDNHTRESRCIVQPSDYNLTDSNGNVETVPKLIAVTVGEAFLAMAGTCFPRGTKGTVRYDGSRKD